MRRDSHKALLIRSPDRPEPADPDFRDPPGVNPFGFLARGDAESTLCRARGQLPQLSVTRVYLLSPWNSSTYCTEHETSQKTLGFEQVEKSNIAGGKSKVCLFPM